MRRDRAAGQASRIAAAVESLAVLHRDPCEWCERRRLLQHPLGEVRVHAYSLPFAGAERAPLVPDRVRHAETTEVVDQSGSVQGANLIIREAELSPGRGRELGDGEGVPDGVRRLQVDEATDREQRLVALLFGERDGQRRLGVDDRVPRAVHRRSGRRSSPRRGTSVSTSDGSNCVPRRRSASATAASMPPTR